MIDTSSDERSRCHRLVIHMYGHCRRYHIRTRLTCDDPETHSEREPAETNLEERQQNDREHMAAKDVTGTVFRSCKYNVQL